MGRSLPRAAVAAVALVLAFSAAPASASHSVAQANFTIYQKGIAGPTYIFTQGCTGTPCTVYITVSSKRDYGRINRWCGGPNPFVLITAGQTDGYTDCPGPTASWYVRATAHLGYLSGGTFFTTTHDIDVLIEVVAQAP